MERGTAYQSNHQQMLHLHSKSKGITNSSSSSHQEAEELSLLTIIKFNWVSESASHQITSFNECLSIISSKVWALIILNYIISEEQNFMGKEVSYTDKT